MIELTWYGTATILLNIDGEKFLFDPFFRMNKKLEQPKLKEFCEVDYIFNTHPHFDHLCDLPKILKTQTPNFMAHQQPIFVLRHKALILCIKSKFCITMKQ